MENVKQAKYNIFKEIKNVLKDIFMSNDDVINNVEDIMDWDDCLSNIDSDSFNESDREFIKSIVEAEKDLENAKNKVNGIRKDIKNTKCDKDKHCNSKIIEKKEIDEIIKE